MTIEARPAEVRLKDGETVAIRPMSRDDVERSLAIFLGLPEEDRRYLRVDVTKRDNVERRVEAMEAGRVRRLVAIAADEIVADGALELSPEEWTANSGEIRLIVSRPYQRRGLGMLMARELYLLAISERLEHIVVRFAGPQVAARSIFHRLGFEEEFALPNHILDRTGHRQDLVLMRCDVAEMWRELESFFEQADWQRTR
ncbi:MAG: GNAT family N-acetyltransferase [Dehalococcoidia bacterium]